MLTAHNMLQNVQRTDLEMLFNKVMIFAGAVNLLYPFFGAYYPLNFQGLQPYT